MFSAVQHFALIILFASFERPQREAAFSCLMSTCANSLCPAFPIIAVSASNGEPHALLLLLLLLLRIFPRCAHL